MKYRFISVALTAAVLLLSSTVSSALDSKAEPTAEAASKAKVSAKSPTPTKSEADTKGKAAAATKLVDINAASSKELTKLPGISDAAAAKIIAGRPYGSKAQLVSRNIIDSAAYDNIRQLIIAKQPYKDAAKNAAIYAKPK